MADANEYREMANRVDGDQPLMPVHFVTIVALLREAAEMREALERGRDLMRDYPGIRVQTNDIGGELLFGQWSEDVDRILNTGEE